MSDFQDDPRPGSPADLREQIDQARADADAAVEAERERATALERELAFTKAGVDTDSPAGKIFFKGYDGELDVEAIRASAATMNLTGPAPADPAAAPTPEAPSLESNEAQLLQAGASLGGTPPPPEPVAVHPAQAANDIHAKAIADGMDNPTAVGMAFNSLVNAAHAGDDRGVIRRE